MSTEWRALVHGCAELEPGRNGGVVPQRLPPHAREQIEDPFFRFVASCPTGVVLRFDTAATGARLRMSATTVSAPGVLPARPKLVVRQDGTQTVVDGPSPSVVRVDAANQVTGIDTRPVESVELPIAGSGATEVFLPHNMRVELVALEADQPIIPVPDDGFRWTHYGSSISQGLNAASAAGTWPIAAAIDLGWRLRDLSFAGNAQLDGFIARLIRDTPADLITLKVGINLVNADSMRERAFRSAVHAFLDTIRDGHPETPIVLISAISCPIHEDAAGPTVTAQDGLAGAARRDIDEDAGALTLARTRDVLTGVVALRADPQLEYLDGRQLFGEADAHLLYDRLHPDQEGLDLIAERFASRMRSVATTR